MPAPSPWYFSANDLMLFLSFITDKKAKPLHLTAQTTVLQQGWRKVVRCPSLKCQVPASQTQFGAIGSSRFLVLGLSTLWIIWQPQMEKNTAKDCRCCGFYSDENGFGWWYLHTILFCTCETSPMGCSICARCPFLRRKVATPQFFLCQCRAVSVWLWHRNAEQTGALRFTICHWFFDCFW